MTIWTQWRKEKWGKLGKLKDVIRGFDDFDEFSNNFEEWIKEQGNVDKDEISKTLSSIYRGKWKNASKGY